MPSFTLTPNGTGQNDGTLTGGATLHAVTSDVNDGTYVALDLGEMAYVYLSTDALDATMMLKSLSVVVRLGVNGLVVARVTIPNFTTYDFPPTNDNDYTLFNFSTVEFPWTRPQTQAELSDLRVKVTNNSGGGILRIAEITMLVDYAIQPTVTVDAPAGSVTDTTSPTVQWTYTAGNDGGPQTRYRVKVFTDAQYGSPGFSPETSAADWDSGTQFGSGAQAFMVDHALGLGDHRAYVKAAQSINDEPHWSEWAYSAFSVDATTPLAPTVDAEPQSAAARVKVTVTRAVGDGVDFDLVEIERSLDSGASWDFVRGATQVSPPGDVFIIYDYEAPNGAPTRYRARAIDVTATAQIAGPWGTSGDVEWSSGLVWLKDLSITSLNVTVMLLDVGDLTRGISQGINRVVGRSAPVVVSDVRQSIVGTLVLMTTTLADARALLDLFDLGRPLLLQTPEETGFGSRYLSFASIPERHPGFDSDPTRLWDCDFVEVDRPVDEGLEVVGLTYQDLLDTFADYQDIVDNVATYGEFYI